MEFYKKAKEEVIEEFLVDTKTGLNHEQILKQRELHGENKLPDEEEESYLATFLKSFKEPIVIVLLGAVALSFASSYYAFQFQNDSKHGMEALYEAIAILILIIINAFLGFYQEISARKSLNALKEMNNRYVTVLRNGQFEKILSKKKVGALI